MRVEKDERRAPLEIAEFGAFPHPAGTFSMRLDLATVAVELAGLPDTLSEPMARAYGPYLGAPGGSGSPLRVEALAAPLDYFLPPRFTTQWEAYRVLTAYDDGVFRSVSYRLAAWIDVQRRVGQIAIARGAADPLPRALENFLRSAVAWLALQENGFFLHGAGIVRNGLAFLFYGPSGAGKSTLAALSDEGQVISDDLTLLLRRPEGLVAAGAPFRGTYREGVPLVGTFPVAAFYRLRKDELTCVRPDGGGCFADLLGNLPFVVDQMPRHPEIIDRVRTVVGGTPLRTLHFRKDRSFWPAVAGAEGESANGAQASSSRPPR